MDTKDYISSGILELYVTGALTEAERLEVEKMARLYPEVKQELESIEMAMEDYAFAHEKTPSPRVLEGILNNIEKTENEQVKILPMSGGSRLNSRFRMLAFAASILLFLSMVTNIYYYSRYQRVSGELADLRDDNTFLTDQYKSLKANYNGMEKEMAMLHDPAMIALTMKGTAMSPASTSIVYWNKGTGDLYLNANNLPKPADGMQYQLWALVEGKPVDAGVFTMDEGIHQMKLIHEADAFAVTLEPMGGSVSPTLQQLYVMGGV